MKSLFALTLIAVSCAFAQVTPTITAVGNNTHLYSYRLASSDLTTASIQMPSYQNKTVQTSGTFGGATLSAEGSNDGSNWFVLKNAASTSTDLTFTAAGLKKAFENPRYLRLKTTGTSGSTDVNASILFSR